MNHVLSLCESTMIPTGLYLEIPGLGRNKHGQALSLTDVTVDTCTCTTPRCSATRNSAAEDSGRDGHSLWGRDRLKALGCLWSRWLLKETGQAPFCCEDSQSQSTLLQTPSQALPRHSNKACQQTSLGSQHLTGLPSQERV